MKKLVAFLNRYRAFLIGLLKPLGIWGAFCLGAIDASALGLPLDLIVGGLMWSDKRQFWIYCLTTAAGSALGSLVPYAIGRAGGEVFLLRRTNRARFERLRDRFEKQEFLALMIPAILPPPTPFKLFVFAAGVFEIRIPVFLLAILTGRVIRFALLAFLVLQFGPHVIPLVLQTLGAHALIIIVIVALGILGALLRRKARVA